MNTPLALKRRIFFIVVISSISIAVFEILYSYFFKQALFSTAKSLVITLISIGTMAGSFWWANQKYEGYDEDEKKYKQEQEQKAKKLELKYGKTINRVEITIMRVFETLFLVGFVVNLLIVLFDTENAIFQQWIGIPVGFLGWLFFRNQRLAKSQTEEERKKDPLNIRRHLDKLKK